MSFEKVQKLSFRLLQRIKHGLVQWRVSLEPAGNILVPIVSYRRPRNGSL